MLLPLHNVGSSGVNLDVNSFELPPEFISGGINFRVANQSIISLRGDNAYSTPTSTFTSGYVTGVRTASSDYIVVCGRSDIQVYNGSTWTSIKPAGFSDLGAGTELLWVHCTLGQIPIFTNSASYPMYWSPQSPSTALQYLKFNATNTWSASNKSAKVFRAHGTYLFALNLTESGVDYPDSFRWSHPADINGLPFTWDETDLSAVAGISSVGNGVELVDGLSLRDTFVLYSKTAINLLRPSGDEFIWSRSTLSDTIGLAAKNAVVESDGIHYFISQDDFLMFDGASINSIAHGLIKSTMRANANKQYWDRCYVLKSQLNNEIWFCVPEGVATLPNKIYAYNYRDRNWSIRTIADGIAYITYAPKTATDDLWSADDGTWNDWDVSWDFYQYADDLPIAVSNSTGALTALDDPVSTTGAEMRIERHNMQIGNLDTATTITRVYPRISGSGSCDIQFGSHDYPGAPVRWGLKKTFNPETQRKIEVRTTGKLHAWQLICNNPSTLKFSGFDIEYEMSGNR